MQFQRDQAQEQLYLSKYQYQTKTARTQVTSEMKLKCIQCMNKFNVYYM